MRRIVYVTGTRADFGLMLPSLRTLAGTPDLSVELFVTGAHLSSRFGNTVDDVRASGLTIRRSVPVALEQDTRFAMATAAAEVSRSMTAYLETSPPDLCLLLGDRWEMLAAGTSAFLCGVPIVHVCGGERTGSIDDMLRHAITRLAHVHCVSTEGARRLLLAMGEPDDRIHVVGAPGLVGLRDLVSHPRERWAAAQGLDADRPIAIVLFHPVVQDAEASGIQMAAVLEALRRSEAQAVCLMPNSDSGHGHIRNAIAAACAQTPSWRSVTHLDRTEFVSMLATADVLLGNSSAGIVEAATFGTPVVNVGDRQAGRERNPNVFDCVVQADAIADALKHALRIGRFPSATNVYGDGRTDERIRTVIQNLAPAALLLKKPLAY